MVDNLFFWKSLNFFPEPPMIPMVEFRCSFLLQLRGVQVMAKRRKKRAAKKRGGKKRAGKKRSAGRR